MTDSLEKYLNDPELADEPMALREIHAIRLKIKEDTKNMTHEERTACIRQNAAAVMEKYGLFHLVVEPEKSSR